MRYFNNDRFSVAGSPEKVLYAPIVKDDGTIELKESGKENLQEYIDSFAEECDINVIVAKFAAGDIGVLNQRVGTFGDFTKLPKTFAEMLQLQIDSKKYFDGLPVEIKQMFNNDCNQFFAQTGTKEWYEIMNSMYPQNEKTEDIVVEKGEVKE